MQIYTQNPTIFNAKPRCVPKKTQKQKRALQKEAHVFFLETNDNKKNKTKQVYERNAFARRALQKEAHVLALKLLLEQAVQMRSGLQRVSKVGKVWKKEKRKKKMEGN